MQEVEDNIGVTNYPQAENLGGKETLTNVLVFEVESKVNILFIIFLKAKIGDSVNMALNDTFERPLHFNLMRVIVIKSYRLLLR